VGTPRAPQGAQPLGPLFFREVNSPVTQSVNDAGRDGNAIRCGRGKPGFYEAGGCKE